MRSDVREIKDLEEGITLSPMWGRSSPVRFFIVLFAVVALFAPISVWAYNMNNGQVTTCSGYFYDSRGPDRNYRNRENKTETFYPATAGQSIKFVFTAFRTERRYDYLYIYNGNNTNAPLLGKYTGTYTPGTIISTASDGSITFRFTSDWSVTKSGWEATISCVPPPDAYYMSDTTITTCNGVFMDPAGYGNYANQQDFTETFYPATAGAMLKFIFTSFDLEYESTCGYDYLEIYDGNSTSASLIGKYCGSLGDGPGTVVSTASDGSITFKFHSDEWVTGSGWEATIVCVGALSCSDRTDSTDCVDNGCYWWGNACHDGPEPVCSDHTDSTTCVDNGCYWYDAACHDSPPTQPPPGPDTGTMPCAYPPFLSNTVPPNVLVIADNSGSMNNQAYYDDYDPTKNYYGYADPDSHYEYIAEVFEPIQTWTGTANPASYRFSGNFLNWLTMRRCDIERKVLVGGKATSRTGSGRKVLIGEAPSGRDFTKYAWCDDGCKWKFTMSDGNINASKYSSCTSGFYSSIWTGVKIKIRSGVTPEGFLQRTYGRCRYGIMHFNTDNGGYVSVYIGSPQANLVTDIENISFDTWTPLAETFYEATRYYQATTGYYTNANYAAHDPIQAWCQNNFVIILTDGESTQDRNLPSWLQDYDNDGEDPGNYSSNGSDYLDDVALWSHTTDLRADFDGDQQLKVYTVYCFGTSSLAQTLLQHTAMNGGFTDGNDNSIPDVQSEWDADGDGVADGYYGAASGYEIESSLNSIFIDIMSHTSAAAAVSVVSTSTKGEGNVFQAYFSPQITIAGSQLSWIGNLHALWIDQWGNLREDSNDNDELNLKTDRILHIYFDSDQNATVVDRYTDTDGDGEEDALYDQTDIDSVLSVWRGGNLLWRRSPDYRTIKTIVPGSSGKRFMDFTASHADSLAYLLRAQTIAHAESLINYVRGTDYTASTAWRHRTADGDVWKLSDIVHSSPTYVGTPVDRYDLLYKDVSYRTFFAQYKDRRGVVYVGANDGMIHCFNAGRFIEGTDLYDRGYVDNMSETLGKELWAVIPYDLLPHLQWLANSEYCHVYYVDSKPKVFDAKMFTADDTHPNGWGTVMVVGMNFGGSPYDISGLGTLRSALVALDITDPENPVFLWEISSDDLGFTTAYPGVAKIGDKWFVITGSGPTDLVGSSSQTGKVFVVNIADTTDKRVFDSGVANSHFADPVSADVDMDGSVDVSYIGMSNWNTDSVKWEGKIYRIVTHESQNLADWDLTKLNDDIQGPVTSAGAVVMDPYGNLWYFVGTGHYYSDQDETDTHDQYFVGIKDAYWSSGAGTISMADLLDVTDVEVEKNGEQVTVTGLGSSDHTFEYLISQVQQKMGWYIVFTGGQKCTTTPIVLGQAVFFTTFSPATDICSFGGNSDLYGLYYMTGTAHPGMEILGIEGVVLQKSVYLGEGVPTSPSAHIGTSDQSTVLSTQLSTGEIDQHQANISEQKSGTLFWKGR